MKVRDSDLSGFAAFGSAEHGRLRDSELRWADWKQWGPYVSDRAWGTVREDYSRDGDAWEHFPHDHARSRAYRWNEDGLAGFCNRLQNVCMAVAVWNGRDPFLKERLFGLSNAEGNHGEDVKEYYFHLDATPTHSYMKMLYRYPQVAFPYEDLVTENLRRGSDDPEYELVDAIPDAMREKRYFDVTVEYAKADQEDILCRITAVNRGPDPAQLHLLPHLWFRNTWSWEPDRPRPELAAILIPGTSATAVIARHPHLGERYWYVERPGNARRVPLLFTENETNQERLFGSPNPTPFVKDGIHEAVVHGHTDRVRPRGPGTKVAAHVAETVEPGQSMTVHVRFADGSRAAPFRDFEQTFATRVGEADEFYAAIQPAELGDDARDVQRRAFAGLLWSKQFYHYAVDLWLDGDAVGPPPPEQRLDGRNSEWRHLYNLDVISMPDKWEYPWYATWDLAFHTVPLALVDPEWAKRQLILMLREWYMHPNGQLPAYEWALGDVNPPVHAWAAWRVYKIARNATGEADTVFLERVFHKLLLNFTWWVNRKDTDGKNIFQGGFLGLDNIGVFDRSAPLPTGGHLEQADGTAWMGMYCLNMLSMALELARNGRPYEDVATKFFEHFVYIAHAINDTTEGLGLWDEEDGFFYDRLHLPNGDGLPLKIRSLLGLIPMFAVETIEPDLLEQLPRFRRRMEWFVKYRPALVGTLASLTEPGSGDRRLLALVGPNRLRRVLERMLDTKRFLSPYGLRSLSRDHGDHPYRLHVNGETYTVDYEPGESRSRMFGGNSNWRGPVWIPTNFLMIEALQKYHHYYGDNLRVTCPHGVGPEQNLWDVARDLSHRLIGLFLRDDRGRRPFLGNQEIFQTDPDWRDRIAFHEYFHGDDGTGLGASHQTGWTALIAKLIQQYGEP